MGYFDELTEIGSFTVKSGKLFISDPAYNYHTYYARTVPNAKNNDYYRCRIISRLRPTSWIAINRRY